MMNKKAIEKQGEMYIRSEIDNYFDCARKQKCPKHLKANLYQKIGINDKQPLFSAPVLALGLSCLMVVALMFNHSNNQDALINPQLLQAQADLQVAMHYFNQVSLKSLSAVNNNGIKPALIKPLARTYASL